MQWHSFSDQQHQNIANEHYDKRSCDAPFFIHTMNGKARNSLYNFSVGNTHQYPIQGSAGDVIFHYMFPGPEIFSNVEQWAKNTSLQGIIKCRTFGGPLFTQICFLFAFLSSLPTQIERQYTPHTWQPRCTEKNKSDLK